MTNESKKRRWPWVVAVLVVLAVLLGWVAWCNLVREVPQRLADDSLETYFKYGSIGTENAQGVPYWIWLVLPNMFPELLPQPSGWEAFGFNWEQGQGLPVGFSRKTIGFDRVGINCALCHSGRVRLPDDARPVLVLGGPGNTVDPLAYQRFLFAAANDPRFTGGNVVTEIVKVYPMGFWERQLYRWLLVPQTQKALLEQEKLFAWTDARPDWGRGRIDPGDTIGNSDMQPLWSVRNQADKGWAFHWDGLQTDLREVVLSSAIGDGATPKSLPMEDLQRLQDFIQTLAPPRYGDHFTVDAALAEAGRPIWEQHCARCHAEDGAETGQVLPLTAEAWTAGLAEGVAEAAGGDPWTDPHRAEMWTPEAAAAYNRYPPKTPWKFEHFRSTGGYVNVPLTGLWLRAPYLHNGSVPYLAELFEPPSARTAKFHRGNDLYDPERMGYVSEGPEAERVGTPYDVSVDGNSNQGHLWGIGLSAEEKKALVEYLKTL